MNQNSGIPITAVEAGSPAAKAGVRAGDRLLSINGSKIADVLDYRFYMTDKRLYIALVRDDEEYFVQIAKREYDELGLVFESYLMDQERSCKNGCIFCFIDQLPRGLRAPLYFKDDDARLGFLFGNYVTLTNLEERDIDRIIKLRISPVNISVHTMNPTLRVQMMKNPRAGEVLGYIGRLARAGIKINAQLVLCPGVNDGAELERSLRELCALGETVQSVAVVPVGLTRHRAKLDKLRCFNQEEAQNVIDIVTGFGDAQQKQRGERICHAADELYLLAGAALPSYESYGDFDQLENGVGMLALLEREFDRALETEDEIHPARRITIATGAAAHPFISGLAERAMERFPWLEAVVVHVRNEFFGESVSVAGLLTGGDICAQLGGRDIGDALILPVSVLRHERDLFLDGMTAAEPAERLGCTVLYAENDGFDLLGKMLGRAL